MQYNAVKDNAMQYNAVQDNAMQCNTVWYMDSHFLITRRHISCAASTSIVAAWQPRTGKISERRPSRR